MSSIFGHGQTNGGGSRKQGNGIPKHPVPNLALNSSKETTEKIKKSSGTTNPQMTTNRIEERRRDEAKHTELTAQKMPKTTTKTASEHRVMAPESTGLKSILRTSKMAATTEVQIEKARSKSHHRDSGIGDELADQMNPMDVISSSMKKKPGTDGSQAIATKVSKSTGSTSTGKPGQTTMPAQDNEQFQHVKPSEKSKSAPKATSANSGVVSSIVGTFQMPKDPRTVKPRNQIQTTDGVKSTTKGHEGEKPARNLVSSFTKAGSIEQSNAQSCVAPINSSTSSGGETVSKGGAILSFAELRKILATLSPQSQNDTLLQQKSADVPSAAETTTGSNENLIKQLETEIDALKKQLIATTTALEQCKIDGSTLKAYRSANTKLITIKEEWKKKCNQMQAEIAELPQLKTKLKKSEEKCHLIRIESAQGKEALQLELQIAKERLSIMRQKKKDYKSHLRAILEEKQKSDESVQQLKSKLAIQESVEKAMDARITSRNKENDRLKSKLRAKKVEKTELRKKVKTMKQKLTEKEMTIQDLKQQSMLWNPDQIDDVDVNETHQQMVETDEGETGGDEGENNCSIRPLAPVSELGQSSGYHSILDSNGDDCTTLMAGSSESAPQLTPQELHTCSNELGGTSVDADRNGEQAMPYEEELHEEVQSQVPHTRNHSHCQSGVLQDQFNAPDEVSHQSFEPLLAAFHWPQLKQNQREERIEPQSDPYEYDFLSVQANASEAHARVSASRGTRVWGSGVNRSVRRKRSFGQLEAAHPPKRLALNRQRLLTALDARKDQHTKLVAEGQNTVPQIINFVSDRRLESLEELSTSEDSLGAVCQNEDRPGESQTCCGPVPTTSIRASLPHLKNFVMGIKNEPSNEE